MNKQLQVKKIEMKGVLVDAQQHHKKTKRVGEPHTIITLAIPLMDNRKFEEMCFNQGINVCLKIEYLSDKRFEIKE